MLNFIVLVGALVTANVVSGVIGFIVGMKLMTSKRFTIWSYKAGLDMVKTMTELEFENEQEEED